MEGAQLCHCYLELQSFPKNHKIMVLRLGADLIRYIALLLNEGNNLSFDNDLSGGLIKKINPLG